MKKVMDFFRRNIKILIGIILGIIITSFSVYASIIVQGTDVGYTDTYSIGATTVQGAIDKLYQKASKCPNTAFKLGDYISLTPTKTTFDIPTSVTGYTSNQTINPSELNLWRVIDIHSDGSVDAVSEYTSSTGVYFNDTTGYANFVGGLQTIAASYAKTSYTIDTRMMGYGGQTPTIATTTAFNGSTKTAPATSSTASPTSGAGQELAKYSPGDIGDTLYLKDYLLVKNVYGNVKANKVGTTTATDYWLASRCFLYISSNFYFRGRYVDTSGSLSYSSLRYYLASSATWRDNAYSWAVRPILTLKSGITTSGGNGTKNSPYTLG